MYPFLYLIIQLCLHLKHLFKHIQKIFILLSSHRELSQKNRFSLCYKSRHCTYMIYRVKTWFKKKYLLSKLSAIQLASIKGDIKYLWLRTNCNTQLQKLSLEEYWINNNKNLSILSIMYPFICIPIHLYIYIFLSIYL